MGLGDLSSVKLLEEGRAQGQQTALGQQDQTHSLPHRESNQGPLRPVGCYEPGLFCCPLGPLQEANDIALGHGPSGICETLEGLVRLTLPTPS